MRRSDGQLAEFVADLLERRGAAVEVADARELAVLAPPHIQKSMGLPEFSRLGFGAERSPAAIPVGLEGDSMTGSLRCSATMDAGPCERFRPATASRHRTSHNECWIARLISRTRSGASKA